MNHSVSPANKAANSPKLHDSATPALHRSNTPTFQIPRIVTIGVYGFDEAGFFNALGEAGVDTFCDIRFRRGVRGREYAFVNSRRLQSRLTELNIRYLHVKELAPSRMLRDLQKACDKAHRSAKRRRAELSDSFIAGYREERLAAFDSARFVEQLGGSARVAALFCVERAPAACHRSLVADRLQRDLGLEVMHLTPERALSRNHHTAHR